MISKKASKKNRILRYICLALVCALAAALLCSCSYVNKLSDAFGQMLAESGKQKSEQSVYEVTAEGGDEFEALLARFREKGYDVEWEDTDPIFLSGSYRVISLNGDETSVNVFLYPTAEDAAEEAGCFSEDAKHFTKGTTGVDINWAFDPHLYLSGRMIIFYIGTDPSAVALMEEMFGEQFAGVSAGE